MLYRYIDLLEPAELTERCRPSFAVSALFDLETVDNPPIGCLAPQHDCRIDELLCWQAENSGPLTSLRITVERRRHAVTRAQEMSPVYMS